MSAATDGRACVAEATASAKLLYTVLCHEGPRTQSALVDETGLNRETIQRAISKLVDCGVVTESRDPTDARRKRYRPVDSHC
ncbi:MarR family transcriptional regulator [Halohasta litorea]|uniref:MarR family transcriptional regulator n=1 Tax=Halohasta litorea TaxID=869891 RepID=A0ABD6D4Q2_9EURY|nr:helix-turn-helix domain-containing protein [Halohasta litorea]MEA1931521.1 helix-turn-helix domain-containing protein [Euryarchaeota archaeon]